MKEKLSKWFSGSRLKKAALYCAAIMGVSFFLNWLLVGTFFSTAFSLVATSITAIGAVIGFVSLAGTAVTAAIKGIVNGIRYIFNIGGYRNQQKLTKEQKQAQKQTKKLEKENKKEAKKIKKQEKAAKKLAIQSNNPKKAKKVAKKVAKAEKNNLIKEQNAEIDTIKKNIKSEKQADQLEALNNKLTEAKKNLKAIKKNNTKEIVRLEEKVVAQQLPQVEAEEIVKKPKSQLNEENQKVYDKVKKEIRKGNLKEIENISSQDAVVWLDTLASWKKELKGKDKEEYTVEDTRHLAMIKSQTLIKRLKAKAETSQAETKNSLSEISEKLLNNEVKETTKTTKTTKTSK